MDYEKDYNIANNVVMKAKDSLQANLGKCTITNGTVSYTHLDVYKRQVLIQVNPTTRRKGFK